MQDKNYPVNGMDKIYKQGITFMIDSFAHTDQKDITYVRDEKRSELYEQQDTPVDGFDESKLLIHNKNEIPLFLGPYKRYFTLERYSGSFIGEVQIPLKVVDYI